MNARPDDPAPTRDAGGHRDEHGDGREANSPAIGKGASRQTDRNDTRSRRRAARPDGCPGRRDRTVIAARGRARVPVPRLPRAGEANAEPTPSRLLHPAAGVRAAGDPSIRSDGPTICPRSRSQRDCGVGDRLALVRGRTDDATADRYELFSRTAAGYPATCVPVCPSTDHPPARSPTTRSRTGSFRWRSRAREARSGIGGRGTHRPVCREATPAPRPQSAGTDALARSSSCTATAR